MSDNHSSESLKQDLVILLTIILSATLNKVLAQIPVEYFAGHKRSTVDVMFFRYFKNKEEKDSRFLFFNRNRASVDYRMTDTEYLPQYGFTEALSYNHPKLKGLAPVAVAQFLNSGVYPKAGIQYARVKSDFTLFTWLVHELKESGNTDYFLLLRYTPEFSDRFSLFTQLELISALPSDQSLNYNFIQRLRLGGKWNKWQTGFGADFGQSGRSTFVNSNNLGIFLRYEF